MVIDIGGDQAWISRPAHVRIYEMAMKSRDDSINCTSIKMVVATWVPMVFPEISRDLKPTNCILPSWLPGRFRTKRCGERVVCLPVDRKTLDVSCENKENYHDVRQMSGASVKLLDASSCFPSCSSCFSFLLILTSFFLSFL